MFSLLEPVEGDCVIVPVIGFLLCYVLPVWNPRHAGSLFGFPMDPFWIPYGSLGSPFLDSQWIPRVPIIPFLDSLLVRIPRVPIAFCEPEEIPRNP